MAEAVKAYRKRVPLSALVTAAAAIDRTGAVAVTWRSRVAAAIDELATAGLVVLPATRWDRAALPPWPEYVTRMTVEEQRPVARPEVVVWHAELGWAAQLEAAGRLGPADRRILAGVNSWLRRRGD